MEIGDVVKITAGPFAGLCGQLKASGPRVLIAVEIRGRQLAMEMDLDWVSAETPERRPAMGREDPSIESRSKGA